MNARLLCLLLTLTLALGAGCPPANDDDSASNDDDATSNDDDATSNDDDATSDDDDATSDDDDATGDDDDATDPPAGSITFTGELSIPDDVDVPTGDVRVGVTNLASSFDVVGGAWSELAGALADGMSYSLTLPPDVPSEHLSVDGDYSRAFYTFGLYIDDDGDTLPSAGDIYVAGSTNLLIYVPAGSVISANSAALGIEQGWNLFDYNWGGTDTNANTALTEDFVEDLSANLLLTSNRETLPLTWETYSLGVQPNMAMVHEASVGTGIQLEPFMHDDAFTPANPVLTHAWDFVSMATPAPADADLETYQGRFAYAKYVAVYYGDDEGNQLYEPPADEICGHSYYAANGIDSWGALYTKPLDFSAHAAWFLDQPMGWMGMEHGSSIQNGQPTLWTSPGAWERYVWINNFACD